MCLRLAGTTTELARRIHRLMTPTAEIERSGHCVGCGLQGKTELFVAPVVDKLLPGQVQVH